MSNERADLAALVEAAERRHEATTAPREIEWHGLAVRVLPGVFDPEFSNVGDLLSTQIEASPGVRVLDLGTGSGIQALVAARAATAVVAIELQAEGVACARANVQRLGLAHKIEVRQGDLFAPLLPDERFDRIVFNFPFVPWEPETEWQRANFDPGHRLLRRFFAEVRGHLTPAGEILLAWSDIGDTALLRQLADEQGLTCETRAERRSANVKHYVFALGVAAEAARAPSSPGER